MSRHERNAALHAAGDFDTLIVENRALARTVIRRLCPRGLSHITDRDDMNAIADVALTVAVRSWNPERGRLGSHLHYVTLEELDRARSTGSGRPIRVPTDVHALSMRLLRDHALQLGQVRDVDLPHVADLLGVTAAKARAARDMIRATTTITTDTLPEKASPSHPENEALLNVLREDVRAAVAALPQAHRDTITARYGLTDDNPATLPDIATREGITKQGVADRLTRAEASLRVALGRYRGE